MKHINTLLNCMVIRSLSILECIEQYLKKDTKLKNRIVKLKNYRVI